jgi:hypothetical protein
MENQDPLKSILEKREQQNISPELHDQKVEQSLEKDSAALLSDINNNIENKNQITLDTKNKIDDIRNSLGLPPLEEIPPSIKIEQEAINKLNQEKSLIENQNRIHEVSQESQNENIKKFESNLRSAIDDISIKSKTMLDALYERQQQRFTPLQNPDEFQGMVIHLKNIKNLNGRFDINGLQQINENIQKISRLIANMNPKSTGGGMRDNPSSLEKLAYGAKFFSASLDEARRKLASNLEDEKIEEKRKELTKNLGALSEQTQKLNSLVLRMRASFH